MARPRSENPRSQRVVARCTVEEKNAFNAAAVAAGESESEYARRLLFGGGSAGVREPVPAGPVSGGGLQQAVASRSDLGSRAREQAGGAVSREDFVGSADRRRVAAGASTPGILVCPEHGCPFTAGDGSVRCPVHGTLVQKRKRVV